MHVSHLWVADFRNYEQADVAFSPGVTFLVGRNGEGKTNLVEAVGYLATLASHRVASDAPLVRMGAERAVVRGAVEREGRRTTLEIEINPGRANRASINRASVTRVRDVLGTLRTVLFAPEDLSLVKGDPAARRDFLDGLLVARQPRWAAVRADYDRALKQRNALLRNAATRGATGRSGRSRGGPRAEVPDPPDASLASTLDVWDDQLAGLGGRLLYARLRLLHDLVPRLQEAYATVSESRSTGGGAHAAYRAGLGEAIAAQIGAGEVPEMETLQYALLEALTSGRDRELVRGTTLSGPHRDELVLTLSGMPAKGYASHGESWSFALALKLASHELLRNDLGEDPVLVLDDVFAELDQRRRERLAELVGDAEQVLVTAAVEEDLPVSLSGRRLRVSGGHVEADDG